MREDDSKAVYAAREGLQGIQTKKLSSIFFNPRQTQLNPPFTFPVRHLCKLFLTVLVICCSLNLQINKLLSTLLSTPIGEAQSGKDVLLKIAPHHD